MHKLAIVGIYFLAATYAFAQEPLQDEKIVASEPSMQLSFTGSGNVTIASRPGVIFVSRDNRSKKFNISHPEAWTATQRSVIFNVANPNKQTITLYSRDDKPRGPIEVERQ